MQYKFYVDGEWRHDEHQPYMTSEIGVVNTIFLTPDCNSISGVPGPNASPRSMEVDNNEAIVHLVTFTHDVISDSQSICVSLKIN